MFTPHPSSSVADFRPSFTQPALPPAPPNLRMYPGTPSTLAPPSVATMLLHIQRVSNPTERRWRSSGASGVRRNRDNQHNRQSCESRLEMDLGTGERRSPRRNCKGPTNKSNAPQTLLPFSQVGASWKGTEPRTVYSLGVLSALVLCT